jgi:hypothetical protein
MTFTTKRCEAPHLSAAAFARRWVNFGFAADHPNAALTLLDAENKADTLVVELLIRPRYDRRRRTMRYVVRQLGHATGLLSDFEAGRDRHIAGHFGAASLFIDDAGDELIEEPGDDDALPHNPATIPPDQGDDGRVSSQP